MKRHKKAVLVGNGINLVAGLGPSWEDLVKDVFRIPADQELEPHMKITPFPLLIESAFSPDSIGAVEEDIQGRLVKQLDGWSPGPVHERLAELRVDHVLTTNWDLTLERVHGHQPMPEKPFQNETRYSLYRRNLMPNGLRVWHIHGSIDTPRTMLLGFEHYSGHLHVMRQAMVDVRRYKKRQFGPVIKMVKSGSPAPPRSWLEIALTYDLLIIGLRLDFAELGLWWLLTYRARALRKRFVPATRVVFAQQQPEKPSERDVALRSQLAACGIEVWEYRDTWDDVYFRAFEQFTGGS